jgi:hypothetical protein
LQELGNENERGGKKTNKNKLKHRDLDVAIAQLAWPPVQLLFSQHVPLAGRSTLEIGISGEGGSCAPVE